MKKYKLAEETRTIGKHVLHRIKALKSFDNVKKGELGGFVEKEDNLSHKGNCWVFNNAQVFENAQVYGNARLLENAQVYGNADVSDEVQVYGCARVYGYAKVYGNAEIYENTEIHGNAWVYDNAIICGNAEVTGSVKVNSYAFVCANALIKDASDYIVFKNWWSSGRYFTWTRSNNMWAVGCFFGTGEELITEAYNDSKESGREYKRIVKYVESIKRELK